MVIDNSNKLKTCNKFLKENLKYSTPNKFHIKTRYT